MKKFLKEKGEKGMLFTYTIIYNLYYKQLLSFMVLVFGPIMMTE